MRRTITYRTGGEAIPAPGPMTPTIRERRPSELGTKIRTALAASLVRWLPYFLLVEAGFIGVALLLADVSLVVIGIGSVAVLGLYIVAVLFVFANLAYDWAVKLGEYDWEAEIDERKWQRQWEQDERDWQRRQAEEARQAPQISPADRLPIVAFSILSRHFSGQPTTRDACEEAGIMTQAEWNLANAAFKALGWKRGKTLDPPCPLQAAWATWEARMRVYSGHVQIKTGTSWQEIKV